MSKAESKDSSRFQNEVLHLGQSDNRGTEKDDENKLEDEARIPMSNKWLPQHPDYLNGWLTYLLKSATKKDESLAEEELKEIKQFMLDGSHPIMTELNNFFASHSIVRMYVSLALEQCKSDISVEEFLIILCHLLTVAPTFHDDADKIVATPVALALGQIAETSAGRILFQQTDVADAIRQYLDLYGKFLSSPQSWEQVKDGWLSPGGKKLMKLDDYIIPENGFTSWNDFFTRRIKPSARPIAEPENNKIVIFPCDGVLYDIKRNIKEFSTFWVKSQPYSLSTILNYNKKMIEEFDGGDIVQIFLNPYNYHHWHAPVSGKVVKVEHVNGLYFSLLKHERCDKLEDWTGCLPYMGMVNRRTIIYIQNEEIGLVAFIPVGMLEVSSIIVKVNEFFDLKKADELGYFQFGGSTALLLFQKNAIKEYFVQPTHDPNDGIVVHFGEKLALAN